MTSNRYLPRAPSLRPAPKRRTAGNPELERALDFFLKDTELATAKAPPSLPAPGAGGQSRVPPLPLADLPAQPARGPWEPKED